MSIALLTAALALAGAQAGQAAPVASPHAMPGEEPIDAYAADPANVGARAFRGEQIAAAFHGQAGIRRIVDTLVDRLFDDPRIGEIFVGHDAVRLRRTLFEQICHVLNAGCAYTGRDMKSAHKDIGLQHADMNRMVEHLQAAMAREGVSFAAQNRLLSKLAPMRRDVVER